MAKNNEMKLEAILKAQVGKGDKEVALEQVAKAVKLAKRQARSEVEAAGDHLENLSDSYNTMLGNASTSLTQIVDMEREIALATANVKALTEAEAARF